MSKLRGFIIGLGEFRVSKGAVCTTAGSFDPASLPVGNKLGDMHVAPLDGGYLALVLADIGSRIRQAKALIGNPITQL
jgi:hypothetical protein